ncbi:uncharacterized protein [Spinacia oleracea]|uniref:Uncharacterized protein isoform X2 n=1 Tax=Spinacia oleracea TaxID=3562 RepID=A0A9R0IDQ6_SPIOL|nr:uncharacterized protein LOC110787165 isoform X2 [Spinacia oleracea]
MELQGNVDDDDQPPSTLVRQFYFPKVDMFYPDPDLLAKLNKAKELKKQLLAEKTSLSRKIRSLKHNIEVLYLGDNGRQYWYQDEIRTIKECRSLLFKHWPETMVTERRPRGRIRSGNRVG